VVEFNCRLGDPEAQPIFLRLKSDFFPMVEHAIAGTLDEIDAQWDRRAALGVVLAAAGYPDTPRKGDEIHGLPGTRRISTSSTPARAEGRQGRTTAVACCT